MGRFGEAEGSIAIKTVQDEERRVRVAKREIQGALLLCGGRAIRRDGRFQSLFWHALTHSCGTHQPSTRPAATFVSIRRIVMKEAKSGAVDKRGALHK